MAVTGYEDITNWSNQQNKLMQEQQAQQNAITKQETQMNVDELARERDKINEQTDKTTSGLYTNYQKNVNNYGVQAEQRARMGLANSGYAETSRINLYNAYQKNVTDTVNEANKLKADFDFKISQARQQGSLTMAKNALALLQQKSQLLTQEYEMKNNREQYLYQQQRDKVADNQWQQNFDFQKNRAAVQDSQWQQNFNYQKNRDTISDNQWQQSFDFQKNRAAVSDNQWQQNFDYQKSRDAVSDSQWQTSFDYQKSRDEISDSQWERQFELSKKASASSSRKSGSSSRSRSGGSSYRVSGDDTAANDNSSSQGVYRLSNNVIGFQKPDGTMATLTITPNATDEQIKAWGEQNGISNILDLI